MSNTPPPTEWELSRTPDDPEPDGTESVVLVPPAAGAAPTTAPLPAVAGWGLAAGDIWRPEGTLPSEAHLNPAATSLPWPIDTWDFGDGALQHIVVEVAATGGPTTLTADWRDSGGAVVTDRQSLEDDGETRYVEFALAGQASGRLAMHIEAVQGGGEVDIRVSEVLAFAGTERPARLVAMIADKIFDIGGSMGITTQEAIALIDRLVPPAQRIGALTGHGGELVAVAADESGLGFAAAAATPADVDRRLSKLEQATADLHAPPAATGWQNALPAQGGVVLFAYDSPPSLDSAAAASGWAVAAGPTAFGDHPVARIAHGDNPQQARLLVAGEDGEQADLLNHWTALGPSGSWDYYIAPGSYAADLRLTLQVTGSAAHIGASRYTGELDGALADGIVGIDALAAAVAARLNPA